MMITCVFLYHIHFCRTLSFSKLHTRWSALWPCHSLCRPRVGRGCHCQSKLDTNSFVSIELSKLLASFSATLPSTALRIGTPIRAKMCSSQRALPQPSLYVHTVVVVVARPEERRKKKSKRRAFFEPCFALFRHTHTKLLYACTVCVLD